MTATLTDKLNFVSLHILNLILDLEKHEASNICALSHAFSTLNPAPQFEDLDDLDEFDCPKRVCADTPIPYEPVDGDRAKVQVAFNDGHPPVESVVVFTAQETTAAPAAAPATAPATAVATVPAKKAARKTAAKKEPAPLPTPEPAANLPGALEEPEAPAATDTGAPLSPAEAERFRALVRDTYVCVTKKLAKEGDADNVRRGEYTQKFTQLVESFGAKTVSLVESSQLPALLDAVRAIAA